MKNNSFEVLVVFLPIFVAVTRMTFVYNFVAPLEIMFNNGAQFENFLFFPSEMGNFRLFQQVRCEVIVKYTNCNLLDHE